MNKLRKNTQLESKPVVPITPMLDLTFQLLFFFITLFDPNTGTHKIEGQMDLMLPAAKEKQAQNPDDVKPQNESDKDDPDLDIPADLTVIVNTNEDSNGTISSLFVEDRVGKTQVVYDNRLVELHKYLKEQREKADHASIRVQGDSKLRWEAMVHVMDICRKAGFESVGFMQPPDFNASNP
jgi:biopolymer transport protein ExbD